MPNHGHLSLDEFLAHVANAEEAAGNPLAAADYRRRVKEARQLAADAVASAAEVSRLKDTLSRLQIEISRAV